MAATIQPNGYDVVTTESGEVSIEPSRPNHDFKIVVVGFGRTVPIVIGGDPERGDLVMCEVEYPASVAFGLVFYHGSTDGTLLLPAAKYPDRIFIADGVYTSARFRFVFTGSEWKYVDSQAPA
jgi:hypothetical protein